MKPTQIIPVLLLFLLNACTTGMVTHEQKIPIGGAFSLTGDASSWGQDEYKAAQMAVDETNARGGIHGTHVTLIAEDTATDAKTTLSAVHKLIDTDHVPAIIGPTWGDSFAQMTGPVAQEAKVVEITPSGAIEVVKQSVDYTYFYSTFFTIPQEIEAHMKYLKAHNYTKAVVVRDQDPFNTKMVDEYKAQAAKNGIQIVGEYIIQDDKDYRTALLKAKQADPDILFVETLNVNDMGLMMRSMQELGMRAKFSSSASVQTNDLLESFAGYAQDRLVYSSPDLHTQAYADFQQRFREKYGALPSGSTAAGAYDATRAVIEALNDGARTGEDIKRDLDVMRIDGTVTDTLAFNRNGGIDGWTFKMKTVKDGQYVDLS